MIGWVGNGDAGSRGDPGERAVTTGWMIGCLV